MRVYGQGHGDRGSLTWEPVASVSAAMEDAFYKAFGFIEPTGKRVVFALDVSGSMDGNRIAGTALDARTAAAAMLMATVRVEERYETVAFSHELVRMKGINKNTSLPETLKIADEIPMGGTDCALPMIWAKKNDVKADAFVVYTDNETWFNRNQHPIQALRDYRTAMGIPAKLVVVGMTATDFSIADPDDNGNLDVVGFDTAAPNVISDFIAGR
jgi:60 kDa SS-A/Ro ribonucleoprotein